MVEASRRPPGPAAGPRGAARRPPRRGRVARASRRRRVVGGRGDEGVVQLALAARGGRRDRRRWREHVTEARPRRLVERAPREQVGVGNGGGEAVGGVVRETHSAKMQSRSSTRALPTSRAGRRATAVVSATVTTGERTSSRNASAPLRDIHHERARTTRNRGTRARRPWGAARRDRVGGVELPPPGSTVRPTAGRDRTRSSSRAARAPRGATGRPGRTSGDDTAGQATRFLRNTVLTSATVNAGKPKPTM